MRSKREKLGEKFIYVVFVVWMSSEILLSSTLEYIFTWKTADVNETMALLVLVLLVIQLVFLQQYKLSEIVLIAMLTIPIAYATVNSGHKTMMSTWIFIVAAKYIDLDKLIKIAYFVQILMCFLVIYLFVVGVINETVLYRGELLRHSLGFIHPNQLGVRVFQISVCRCYIRRQKINLADVVLTIAEAIIINRVANSKTAYYALIILAVILLLHIVAAMAAINIGKMADLAIAIAIISNAISIFMSFIDCRKYPVLGAIDKLLSRRFYQCHKTLRFYGVSVWGQDVQKIVKRHIIGRVYHFWLDNAYMAILLRYGVVVFLVFSSLYIATMVYLKNEGQYVLLEILCLYAIYGIMENNFFGMSQNIFLLALSYPIYKRSVPKEKMIKPKIRIMV